jgi:AcrR family transcriptional regulator
MSPKIQEATIREQRQMRQRQLMDAALSLAMADGVESVTVSAVAKRAGLARSSIYEYFASSADLIADLVMEELAYYNNRLLKAVGNVEDPFEYIGLWIEEALQYVVDGRHLLVKSLNTVATPNDRTADIAQGHRDLMGTITKPLIEIGLPDVKLGLSYIQHTIDAASVRIESGHEAALEISYAQKYALAGLRALIN